MLRLTPTVLGRDTVRLAAVATIFLTMSGCQSTTPDPPAWTHLVGETMGTTYTVRSVPTASASRQDVQHGVNAILSAVNEQLSTWDADSWISRFNRAPAHEAHPVPEAAWDVLRIARVVAGASDGVCDPAAYPLTLTWGFGPRRGADTPAPTPDEIAAVRAYSSHRALVFDDRARTLSKTHDRTQIDCSAVAKGYAVDRIGQLLASSGAEHYLVSMGGEILAVGRNPEGHRWRIGFEWPAAYRGDRPTAAISGRAVAASGGSQVFKTIGGVRYTHVIDPRSGRPVRGDHPVFSATAFAPEVGLADGLATAGFILGPEGSDGLLDAFPDCGLVFIMSDGRKIDAGRIE